MILELQIPATISELETKETDVQLVNQTPHSISGANIKVSYTVKVFVKHSGWNQRGEGNEVAIPVTVLNQSLELQ